MMATFKVPKPDLDTELFMRRNIFIARFVILNVLAHNTSYQTEILEQIHTDLLTGFTQFLFQKMAEKIQKGEQVNIDHLRETIPSFAPTESEFIRGCLANFSQIVSLNPTSEHIQQAIRILTSTPPSFSSAEK